MINSEKTGTALNVILLAEVKILAKELSINNNPRLRFAKKRFLKNLYFHAQMKYNNGFLKTSDAVAAGVSRTVLGNFVRECGLERVAHGLYMSQDAWEDGMFVIQVRYPQAVFSHESSLCLLNLANREPTPFSVTLRTGTNTAGLSKQGIKVYKVKRGAFQRRYC